MEIKLDSRFKQKIVGMFGKYEFEVGIKDGPHKLAKRGARGQKGLDVITKYAGGPARKKTREDSGMNISDVAKELLEKTEGNFWTDPFEKTDSDIIKFSDAFFRVVFGLGQKKRAENLLQAIVRNPILRGEYGSNSEFTQKIKGFNRFMIDTGQFFKAITAKCKVK